MRVRKANGIQAHGNQVTLEKIAESNWRVIHTESRPGGWSIFTLENSQGEHQKFRGLVRRVGDRCFVHHQQGSWSGQIQYGDLAAGASDSGGEGDLVAQFPGQVRQVLVEVGQALAKGDPIVKVEAMKMEFAVKAPFDGVVKSVLVEAGQSILPGDRFIDLEATE